MFELFYTKTFLKELSTAPDKIRTKGENIVFQDLKTTNPFNLGIVEKLKGYPDKYKIRIGDYRIGLTIDKTNNIIIFQRIAPRKDIYKIFP